MPKASSKKSPAQLDREIATALTKTKGSVPLSWSNAPTPKRVSAAAGRKLTKKDLLRVLAALEQRFGSVTGGEAEANTLSDYADGFMDCLRWLTGRKRLRNPEQFKDFHVNRDKTSLQDLQSLHAALAKRRDAYFVVKASKYPADTNEQYRDGFMDCLWWITGKGTPRRGDSFQYVLRDIT